MSLNIAGSEPLNREYLQALRRFIADFEPLIVSDHLCWTGLSQNQLHNLLPVPYHPDLLPWLSERISEVQDQLGRRIALENLSAYVAFGEDSMSEWDFLAALAQRADCQILLDLNNLYVNAVNHGFDPEVYLAAIPAERIAQYHLAGYSDTGEFLFDTHDHPVYPPVWDLYARALETKGPRPTLIEWDDHLPDFARLEAEALAARRLWEQLA